MTKYIQLTKGLKCLVDDDDFPELNQYNWYASGRPGSQYAARRSKDHEEVPRKLIYMHRQILGIEFNRFGPDGDHINGDTLDNRRENLRTVTKAENLQNSTTAKKQTGIGYDTRHNRFKAYVNIPEPYSTKRINVGTFKTKEEAVKARETFILKMREEV